MQTACIDFYGSGDKQIQAIDNAQDAKPGRIYLMRGLCGVLSMGMNDFAQQLAKKTQLRTASFAYYRGEHLVADLIEQQRLHKLSAPLILIGHSLGADETIIVAKKLQQHHIPVDLIISLDPVKSRPIPGNVKHVVNVYIGNTFQGMRAIVGSPLKAVTPNKTLVENYNLSADQPFKNHGINHYNMTKNKQLRSWLLAQINKQLIA